MKKILFITLVVTAFNLGAQDYEYIPFATEDALWSVSDEKYSLYGDTVINGIKYSKVYRQEESEAFEFDISKAEYFCAIRNDIENKRVYGVYKDDLPVKYHKNIQYDRTEGKEFLLYDFSLNMGDTVSVANFAEADKEGYIRCVIQCQEILVCYLYPYDIYPFKFDTSDVGFLQAQVLCSGYVPLSLRCWSARRPS